MRRIYIIAVHKEGQLSTVGVASHKREAKTVAEVFSKYGRVVVWKAEEWYPHKIEEQEVEET